MQQKSFSLIHCDDITGTVKVYLYVIRECSGVCQKPFVAVIVVRWYMLKRGSFSVGVNRANCVNQKRNREQEKERRTEQEFFATGSGTGRKKKGCETKREGVIVGAHPFFVIAGKIARVSKDSSKKQ
ncbi:hypothetical protein M5K25_024026 [Dendrobium thyrsiflorum]|uniref:Uncharacterized protein n=1 Tax=Dendrobium thyrsiflorum TaxID=117978 RepID=A0ABD0U116_DENTH